MRGRPAAEREAELELAAADAQGRRARRSATGEALGCGAILGWRSSTEVQAELRGGPKGSRRGQARPLDLLVVATRRGRPQARPKHFRAVFLRAVPPYNAS
jgi:hypothetical protein